MPTLNTKSLSLEKLRQLVAGDEPVAAHVIELLQTLQDVDEEHRAWASDALQTLDALPRELAAGVAAECTNAHPAVAGWACTLLAKLGADAMHYQAAVVACLTEHASESARQQAALALSAIPQLSPQTLDALRRASQNSDPRLKRLALSALENASA